MEALATGLVVTEKNTCALSRPHQNIHTNCIDMFRVKNKSTGAHEKMQLRLNNNL